VDYQQAYSNGYESEVWEQLSDLDVRDPQLFDVATSIARQAMLRVRHNIQLLIARWESAGHRFGYSWATGWAAGVGGKLHYVDGRPGLPDYIVNVPPLLAEPDQETLAALRQYEDVKGPLPIVLRAFYEVVGAVNFVGNVASGWPDREILDPLQVQEFTPQLQGLLANVTDEVIICPDHLHKYFVSGVGDLVVRVPSPTFDPVLRFEGGDLEWEGHPLTFGRYLRYVILKRGGIGLVAGDNDDAPAPALVASLTEGLQVF